jgi:hypothetical protein
VKYAKDGIRLTLLTYVFLLFLGMFIYTLIPYSKGINVTNPSDLTQYLTGAGIVRDGKIKALYERSTQVEYQNKLVEPKRVNGLLAFRTPPIIAALFIPLTFLKHSTTFSIICAINCLLLLLTIYLTSKELKLNKHSLLIGTLFLPLFIPLWATFAASQVTILILFFIVMSYIKINKAQYLRAGLLLGLLFLKAEFLILIPLVLACSPIKKSLKVAKGVAISITALILINVFLMGPSFLTVYPKFLFQSENINYGTAPTHNFNLTAVYPLNSSLAFSIAAYLFFLIVIYISRRKGMPAHLLFAVCVLLTPLLNIHTMPTDLVVLIVPLYLVIDYFWKKKRFVEAAVSAFLLFLAPWFGIGDAKYISVGILTLISVAIYLLIFWRRWEESNPRPEIPSHDLYKLSQN